MPKQGCGNALMLNIGAAFPCRSVDRKSGVARHFYIGTIVALNKLIIRVVLSSGDYFQYSVAND
jgi:hypothetical protein